MDAIYDTDYYLLFSDWREETRALITTRTHEFSSKSIHSPGRNVNTEYLGLDELKDMYYLEIFANGYPRNQNDGYVTVLFHSKFAYLPCLGYCIISVIDAFENTRFSETFTLTDGWEERQKDIQYISREKLLSNREELLPNDVLTLLIDVCFIRRKSSAFNDRRKQIEIWRFRKTIASYFDYSQGIKLLLDSPLAKCLAEESGFFRRLVNTPKIEMATKTMSIDALEYVSFKHIARILMKINFIKFASVKEIFDLYIVADKYDIPAVTELCTCFLKLCLLKYTVKKYIEIANEYEDNDLKELIIKEIDLVRKTRIDEEMTKEKNGGRLKQPIRKCIWLYRNSLIAGKYTSPYEKYTLTYEDAFLAVDEGEIIGKDEEGAFDFYK